MRGLEKSTEGESRVVVWWLKDAIGGELNAGKCGVNCD